MLSEPDPHITNSRTDPDRVTLKKNETVRIDDGYVWITLPPVSWNMIRLGVDSGELSFGERQ
jgi:alpha-N-arabinofuranosidase